MIRRIRTMKRYDMPKIEISYFERECVETLLSGIFNAAGAGNSGDGATVTTGVETLFGKQ